MSTLRTNILTTLDDSFSIEVKDIVSIESLNSNTEGATLIARGAITVESVAELSSVPSTLNQVVVVRSWIAGKGKGGLTYRYDGTKAKSLHNGGDVISNTVPYTTRDAFLAGTGETSPSGFGCWVANLSGINLSVDHFGAYGDQTVDDLPSINKAISTRGVAGGAIKLSGNHRINGCVRIPDNITLWGNRSDKLIVTLPWEDTDGRKAISNADRTNGNANILLVGFTIQGSNTSGSEFDHGVHFGGVIGGGGRDLLIKDCQGDGICLGNFTGGVPLPVRNTVWENCEISGVLRQGIAITCGEFNKVINPYIHDLQDAVVGAGVALDFEPDTVSDICRYNKVVGGYIKNCKGGAYFASVASVTETNTRGNSVYGVTFDTISGEGARVAFWETEVVNCTFFAVAQHGIHVLSSAGVQLCLLSGNNLATVGTEVGAPNTYHGIFLDANVAHCRVVSNSISATTVNNTIKDDTSAGFNVIVNNVTRPSNRAKAINTTSYIGHNPTSNVEVNLHEGFTATGRIHLGNFGLSMAGVPFYPVTGVPNNATGTDGDIVMNVNALAGASLFYRKISGVWQPF